MKTLAIDTSSAVSVVVLVEDGVVKTALETLVATKHEDTLLPHVEVVLSHAATPIADVERLVIGLGPGGFTSLRVGIATAKGLALATSATLVGVGSLRVIARGLVGAEGLGAAVVDAHRGEVYAALYRFVGTHGAEVLPPMHGTPDAIGRAIREAAAGARVVVGGDGLAAYESELRASLGPTAAFAPRASWAPSAVALAIEAEEAARLATRSELDTLEPLYVRPSDAKLPARPLRIPG